MSDKVVTKQHAEAPTEADISALCWRIKLIEYVAVVNVEAIPGGASLDSVHSSAPAMGDMASTPDEPNPLAGVTDPVV